MIIKTDSKLYQQIRRNWLESQGEDKNYGPAKNCQSFVKWIQQQHGSIEFVRTYYPHRQFLRDPLGLVEGVDYIEFASEACYSMFILKYC